MSENSAIANPGALATRHVDPGWPRAIASPGDMPRKAMARGGPMALGHLGPAPHTVTMRCFMMQIAITRVRIVMIVPLHCCCDENNNNDRKKTYLVK